MDTLAPFPVLGLDPQAGIRHSSRLPLANPAAAEEQVRLKNILHRGVDFERISFETV